MTETPDPFAPPPQQPGGQPTPPPPPPPPPPGYGQQPYPPQPYPQQPYPQQPGPSGYPQPYGYAPPAAPSSGMAVAALVVGLVSLVFCPIAGPVAIILGIVAIRRAGRGQAGGKGMAIAGLVLGILGTILAVVATVFLVWFFSKASDCFDPDYTDAQMNACIDQVMDDQFGFH